MPTSIQQIKDTYPIPAYRFQVEVYPYLGSVAAMVAVTYFGGDTWSFAEVSGLDAQSEHHVYRDGLSPFLGPYLLRGIRQHVTVTLRRGVVRGRDHLADWMQTEGLPWSSANRKKNLRIVQVDEAGEPLVTWTLVGAIPTKLSGPQFNAKEDSVAIESIEVVAERMIVNYNP